MQLPYAASLMTGSIPLSLAQRAANLAFTRVISCHPRLFDRLGEHATKTFAFVPTDLPFLFAVTPASRTLRVVRPDVCVSADATVKGPLVLLLALLEGRVDGDAEFFARALTISGDMEAIVALRNALDDSAIDLPSDLAPIAGPLAGVFQKGLERIRETVLQRRQPKWN